MESHGCRNATQYDDAGSEVFEDARSEFGASLRSEADLPRFDDARGGEFGASLRSEHDLPNAAAAPLSATRAVEGTGAQAPQPLEVTSATVAAAAAVPVLATTAQGAAPEGAAPAGADALLMTPRTRARMDPMGDIVRMIETGSARKGARPPNLPSGAARSTPAAAGLGTALPESAEGMNLGAAFDMEAGTKLPGAGAPAALTDAMAEPSGAEFLPPAAVGVTDDVTEEPQPSVQAAPADAIIAEPAGAEFLPPAAVGMTQDVTEPLQDAPGSADPMDAITEPARAEFLPPAAAGVTEDITEPRDAPPQAAEAAGTNAEPVATTEAQHVDPPQSEPAPAATAAVPGLAAGLVAGGAAGAAALVHTEFVDPKPGVLQTPATSAPTPNGAVTLATEPLPASADAAGEAAAPVPADQSALPAPSVSAGPPRVSFAPLPSSEKTATQAEAEEQSGAGFAAIQPLPADNVAAEPKDDLAAAGLPPGPPPIAVPPPHEAAPAASPAPVFSPTDSQPESLADGADVADAELLMLQRAKTREGDAAGTATELPLGTPRQRSPPPLLLPALGRLTPPLTRSCRPARRPRRAPRCWGRVSRTTRCPAR